MPLTSVLKDYLGGWQGVFVIAAIANFVVVALALFVLKPMRARALTRKWTGGAAGQEVSPSGDAPTSILEGAPAPRTRSSSG